MKKKYLFTAGLVVGALALAGCAPAGESTDSSDGELTVAVVSLAASVEPWAQAGHPGQYMWGAVYDALTRIDESGKPSPALAESWTNIDDLTWEFTLRDGVEFQNGEKMNADAVVATFDFLLSEEGRGQYASHVGNYSYINSVTATDESTVVITTETPRPLLANDVSIVFIVPPALLGEGIDALRASPAGTGPLAPVEWTADRIVLEPWGDSWRDAPDVESVEFVQIADAAARFQALQAGDVDVMIGLSPDQEDRIADDANLASFHETVGRMISIKFLANQGGPLEDPDVRTALNLAVNRDSINENLLLGRGVVSAWPPPGVAGHDPEREAFGYDPEAAQELLAEAGYPDGFSFTIEGNFDSWDADRQVYEAIQSDLSQIGVQMDIVQVDFVTDWLPKHNGAQEWAGEGYGAIWVSAPQYDGLRPVMWYGSCNWVAPTFCDPEMQADIDAAAVELDPELRSEYAARVFDRMVENPPALMLFDLPQVWGTGADVTNFDVASVNIDWGTLQMR